MSGSLTGAAVVAGVCGAPIRHSMSPLIHNAWIAAAGLDAVYAPFAPAPERFVAFIEGLRGGEADPALEACEFCEHELDAIGEPLPALEAGLRWLRFECLR